VRREAGDGDTVWSAVWGAIQGAVQGAVRAAIRGAVQGAVQGAVRAAIRGAVWGTVRGAVRGAVLGAVFSAVWVTVLVLVHRINSKKNINCILKNIKLSLIFSNVLKLLIYFFHPNSAHFLLSLRIHVTVLANLFVSGSEMLGILKEFKNYLPSL
jgi:hypothetical protein